MNGVFLINAGDDTDITPLTDGMVINLATLESNNLNIRVTAEGAAGSVGFALTGATTRDQSETNAPHAFFGDVAGDYSEGAFAIGQHKLVVTPYSEAALAGTAGEAIAIQFVVSDGNTNSAPTGSVWISSDLTEGQTLTTSNTLADADGLGAISYQWQRGGVDVAGAVGNSYTLSGSDVGSLIARSEFPVLNAGEVPYYADNGNDALAIDATIVANRDKFARASHTFTGDSGVYPIQITTLTEEDGESTYRLLVNGTVVVTYQNPHIGPGSPLDLQPNPHVWNDIALNNGDVISIESNSDTNGEIPEGDGTAWARGRWRSLELFTGVGPIALDNSNPSINGLFLVNADSNADIIPLTDGARYLAVGPQLGQARDIESDGVATPGADDDGSDEDGVLFGAIGATSPGAGGNIELVGASQARVDAWIDFDQNGSFDGGEKILDNVSVTQSMQTLNYALPTGLTQGDYVARVRLSTIGGLGPFGLAADGEVED